MSYLGRIKNRGLIIIAVVLVLIVLAIIGFGGLVWNGVDTLVDAAAN